MKTARPWIEIVLTLALLLPLLAGCGPRPTPTQAIAAETPSPAAPATSAPTIPSSTLPPATAPVASASPAPTTATGATFEQAACPFELPEGQEEGKTLDCGYLLVPEDRADPNSDTIRLAVAIFHPTGKPEPDPIIYLEGGPGGSALEFLYLSYPDMVQPYLAANREIVLFDQRGAGRSEPALDCPEMDELSLDLLDWEVDGKQLTPEEAADLTVEGDIACARDLSTSVDLSDYNTANNAADVNDLRLALGYDQVNLWSISYGTNLALAVMRDYPQGVRSVILDSVLPPDVDPMVEAPPNAARVFNLLFDSCAADSACNDAYPNLRQVLTDTVAALNDMPAAFQVSNALTGETYDMVMIGDDLMGILFQLFYFDDVIPLLPQMIYDARDGHYELLARMVGVILAQQEALSTGMLYSVSCHDEVPFSSLEQAQASLERYPALKGIFTNSNLGTSGFRTCAGWGAGEAAASANQAISSDIPTLLMSGEFDPITPPSWAQRAARTLKNGHSYEYPALGHGVSPTEGCPRDMALAFIDDPTAMPDDSCIADMPQVAFAVPSAQEAVELEPYTDPQMGTRGVVPAGWEQVNAGIYARSSSSLDVAVILQQAAQANSEDVLAALVQQLGMGETPAPVGEREANDLTWQLYSTEVQGLAIDIALTDSGDTALVVLLQSDPREHDSLYDSVFIPVVDAMQLAD